MGKSVLVMETPEHCIDCPCHFAYENGTVWCGKENKELLADDIETFKPDWCPLRNIPKRKYEEDEGLIYDDFAHLGRQFFEGWNACLDRILNEPSTMR